MRVADLSAWQIETTDLTELNIAAVREGLSVTLTFDALLRLYEEAQAGGIDEPERGQIDDDRIASLLREVAQGRAQ